MCRVIAIRKVEECLDGTTIKEYELDAPMTEGAMRRMAEGGKLKFFPQFPRPYFRIDGPDACIIQGVLGATTVRIVFSGLATEALETFLQRQIEKGEHCGC